MYQKQGFYSGQKLKASQLEMMEDGIINIENISQDAVNAANDAMGVATEAKLLAQTGTSNIEKGAGIGSTQQISDGVADGFDFTGKTPKQQSLIQV